MNIDTMWTTNRTKGRISPVRHIVIHTMEAPEQATTAENIAHGFATSSRQASAHYCIDNNSIVQCVALADTAWACPGFNASGIQLEHAGYAAQSAAQWADAYSVAMLHRSAQLAAQLAKDYGIPVRHLSVTQVRNQNVPGFMGHVDATKAKIGGNNHTDPGEHFPWSTYLALVEGYMKGTAPAPPATVTTSTWVAGPKTVTAWQKFEGTTRDGVISSQDAGNKACMPAANWSTVEWVAAGHAKGSQLIEHAQGRVGVAKDGIAGPVTWKALQSKWLGFTGKDVDGIAGPRTIERLANKVGAV